MKISHYDIIASNVFPRQSASEKYFKKSFGLKLPPEGEILFEEESITDKWNKDFECKLVKKTKVTNETDCLLGPGFIAVNSEYKKAILNENNGPIEFVRTKIVKGDGTIVLPEMYIMRPLTIVDCINTEESGLVYDEKGVIESCERLVLHGNKAFSKSLFIRPRLWPQCILINRYRYIDSVNWLLQHHTLNLICTAYATGKIKSTQSFPEPGLEEDICDILEKVTGGIEIKADLDLGELEIGFEEFCQQLKDTYDLPSDWGENSEILNGTLENLIKHISFLLKNQD